MKPRTHKLNSMLIGAFGIVASAASFNASASMIDGIVEVWTVNVSTIFDTATICDTNNDCTQPNGIDVISNQSLRWGTPATNQGRSGLDITDSPSNAQVDTNGPAVANVSITHLNRPIFAPSLASLTILSTLTLTPFDPAAAGLPPAVIQFPVYFHESDNGANPCADGGANGVGVNINGCADIYVTSNNSLNFKFFYDLDGAGPLQNQEYFISFFELTSGLNPLPAAACGAAGQAAPCLGFRTAENADTTVQFASLITTEPVQIVPEPGILALLGGSLFGLAAFRRRRAS